MGGRVKGSFHDDYLTRLIKYYLVCMYTSLIIYFFARVDILDQLSELTLLLSSGVFVFLNLLNYSKRHRLETSSRHLGMSQSVSFALSQKSSLRMGIAPFLRQQPSFRNFFKKQVHQLYSFLYYSTNTCLYFSISATYFLRSSIVAFSVQILPLLSIMGGQFFLFFLFVFAVVVNNAAAAFYCLISQKQLWICRYFSLMVAYSPPMQFLLAYWYPWYSFFVCTKNFQQQLIFSRSILDATLESQSINYLQILSSTLVQSSPGSMGEGSEMGCSSRLCLASDFSSLKNICSSLISLDLLPARWGFYVYDWVLSFQDQAVFYGLGLWGSSKSFFSID